MRWTTSYLVATSTSQVHGHGFDPQCGLECYNGAMSETILSCWVWRDTCPPPVGWHGAVKMVLDFFIWVTSGQSLHLLGRCVISPSEPLVKPQSHCQFAGQLIKVYFPWTTEFPTENIEQKNSYKGGVGRVNRAIDRLSTVVYECIQVGPC